MSIHFPVAIGQGKCAARDASWSSVHSSSNCPSNQRRQERQPSAPLPGTSAGDLQGQISAPTVACLWLPLPWPFDCPRLLHPIIVPRVDRLFQISLYIAPHICKTPNICQLSPVGLKALSNRLVARRQSHNICQEPKARAFAATTSSQAPPIPICPHFRIKVPEPAGYTVFEDRAALRGPSSSALSPRPTFPQSV